MWSVGQPGQPEKKWPLFTFKVKKKKKETTTDISSWFFWLLCCFQRPWNVFQRCDDTRIYTTITAGWYCCCCWTDDSPSSLSDATQNPILIENQLGTNTNRSVNKLDRQKFGRWGEMSNVEDAKTQPRPNKHRKMVWKWTEREEARTRTREPIVTRLSTGTVRVDPPQLWVFQELPVLSFL